MEDVDHTVSGYLVDYATCLLFTCLAATLLRRQGWGLPALVQATMAVAYLMGSLGHHVFANRAITDQCANTWLYMAWAIAYPCGSVSNLAWLFYCKRGKMTYIIWLLVACHVAANAFVVTGCVWCVATVTHYDGITDECPVDGIGTRCDATVRVGEAMCFACWFVTIAYAASLRKGNLANWISVLALIFGPVQILFVYTLLPSGGAALSEALYTAVTYKTACCISQISIFYLSDRKAGKVK